MSLDPDKYGKPDIERLGLFIEMPFIQVKYIRPFPKTLKKKGPALKSMIGPGSKIKDGTLAGYFDDEFRRVFSGEAIEIKRLKKASPEGEDATKKKKVLPPFMPAGNPKQHSGAGDFYGTFEGIVEAMGRELRPVKGKGGKKKPLTTFLTRPAKKGGPGYADIGLEKYPEYIESPYNAKLKVKQYGVNINKQMNAVSYPKPYFDNEIIKDIQEPGKKPKRLYVEPDVKPPEFLNPNWIPVGPPKWQGGSHAGCFERFPKFKSNRVKPKKKDMKKKEPEATKLILPQSLALKHMQVYSVMAKQVDFTINGLNYKTYQPTYIKRLL